MKDFWLNLVWSANRITSLAELIIACFIVTSDTLVWESPKSIETPETVRNNLSTQLSLKELSAVGLDHGLVARLNTPPVEIKTISQLPFSPLKTRIELVIIVILDFF